MFIKENHDFLWIICQIFNLLACFLMIIDVGVGQVSFLANGMVSICDAAKVWIKIVMLSTPSRVSPVIMWRASPQIAAMPSV